MVIWWMWLIVINSDIMVMIWIMGIWWDRLLAIQHSYGSHGPVLPLNIVDSWKRHQGKNQQRCGKSHGLPRKIVDKCWIFPLGTGSFPPKTPQWTTAWKRFHESRAVHGVTLSTTNSFLLRRGTWKELKAWLQIKTPWFPVDLPSGHLTSISMGHFPWLC